MCVHTIAIVAIRLDTPFIIIIIIIILIILNIEMCVHLNIEEEADDSISCHTLYESSLGTFESSAVHCSELGNIIF